MDKKQSGQIILVLLLIITVALGIGLSIVNRSLSDVSTATKVEQSSRAFSAAEAGIERAVKNSLAGQPSTPDFNLDETLVEVEVKDNLPDAGQALEYPPIGKEEIAHVWLVNPVTLDADGYNGVSGGTSLNIYWGDPAVTGLDVPAIEVSFVYADTSSPAAYRTQKFYYDPDSTRRTSNGFSDPIAGGAGNCSNPTAVSALSPSPGKAYKCRVTIAPSTTNFPSLSRLMLVRARVFYSSVSQPFAVAATSGPLPRQAKMFTSTGTTGDTQRKVRLFQVSNVVPFYFDYALFSAGEIVK